MPSECTQGDTDVRFSDECGDIFTKIKVNID